MIHKDMLMSRVHKECPLLFEDWEQVVILGHTTDGERSALQRQARCEWCW